VYLADPARVGNRETDTLVAYYRRDWFAFLVNAFALAHAAFGMSRRRTLVGSWWVLRANQLWAPPTGNDPAGAQRCMAHFYRLVAASHGRSFDPDRAAELELIWWREHREAGRRSTPRPDAAATLALTELYAHVFQSAPNRVGPAAELRVRAFDASDAWTATAGLDPDSELVAQERALLVESYQRLAEELRHQSDTNNAEIDTTQP